MKPYIVTYRSPEENTRLIQHVEQTERGIVNPGYETFNIEEGYSPQITRNPLATISTGGSAVLSGIAANKAAVGLGAAAIGTAVVGAIGIRKQYHYPGHEYLGPGTDLEKAKDPIDADDKIAKTHDIAYSVAKSDSDIHKADEVAIKQFKDDFVSNYNIHSALGAIGLGVKYAIEDNVGVLYPQVR